MQIQNVEIWCKYGTTGFYCLRYFLLEDPKILVTKLSKCWHQHV